MNRRSPATHGTRRTNADKRRSIETLLSDLEWSKWSNEEVARRCAVSHTLVGTMKHSLSTDESDNRSTYIDRYGRQTTMATSNIGQRVRIVRTVRPGGATTP